MTANAHSRLAARYGTPDIPPSRNGTIPSINCLIIGVSGPSMINRYLRERSKL